MHRGRNDVQPDPACLIAGNVAQDLNNILTVVLGNISLVMGSYRHEEKVLEHLSRAEQAALKIRDLAQQLLSFARCTTAGKSLVDVGEIFRGAVAHVSSPGEVLVRIDLPDDLWQVKLEPERLSLGVKILLVNSVKAMPYGGEINVFAENLSLAPDSGLPLPPGKFVHISIQDQGIGAWSQPDKHLAERALTGQEDQRILGLGTLYFLLDDFLKAHGGHLATESVFGRGTTFHLYLPAAGGKTSARSNAVSGGRPGKARLLLMDDEEMVRHNFGMILNHLGYEVEFAQDGAQALDLYLKARQGERPFDAVIIDLTIRGGLGGRETMERLLKLDPRARAIVFSGDPNDPLISHFQEFGFQGLIKKPYSIKEVSEVLLNVLQ